MGLRDSLLREALPPLLVAHRRLLKTLQTVIAGYREIDLELTRKLSLRGLAFIVLEGAIQAPGGTSIILASVDLPCYNTDQQARCSHWYISGKTIYGGVLITFLLL